MKTKLVYWGLQIVAACILIPVGFFKYTHQQASVMVFTELGMEPTGRYIIGTLEILSGLMLLTDILAASGALLAVGVMLGALIAHITVLGLTGNGNELFITALFIVLISSSFVLWKRKRQLPIIGKNL